MKRFRSDSHHSCRGETGCRGETEYGGKVADRVRTSKSLSGVIPSGAAFQA